MDNAERVFGGGDGGGGGGGGPHPDVGPAETPSRRLSGGGKPWRGGGVGGGGSCGQRRIVGREEPLPGSLTGDDSLGRVGVVGAGDACPDAAVGVTDEHPALGVDGGVDEIEQVPVVRRAVARRAGRADRPP